MESTRVAEAPRASGDSSWLTVLVGVCVAAVALAFALNATDAHSHVFAVFKLIHVSVAVFWVGGGLLLTEAVQLDPGSDDFRGLAES